MTDARLTTTEGRPTLELRRVVDASVDRVWRAVSDPAELGTWFIPALGKPSELGELLGETGAERVVGEQLHDVTWVKDDLRVRFSLDGRAAQTQLLMSITLDDVTEAAVTAASFEPFLDRLEQLVAGEEPDFSAFGDIEAMDTRLARFAEVLDVDPTAGREAAARARAALAESEGTEQSFEPDPAAAAELERAVVDHLRENQDAWDAALERRGDDGGEQMMVALDDWILPSVTSASEIKPRYFFVLDRFIAGQSLQPEDLETAWQQRESGSH
ncbi:hypothetical protein [Flexivirga meconopsidis]|uniref:hypothetical protein n=1 Tax=Flexivirga meconopsidis TaxID=2977121 RepID=UPI00223E946C|nr:hypothetical protein [Flexivirga meconopsidis]